MPGRNLHLMTSPRKSASSFLAALLGFLGFSAIAGLLVTVIVAPALAVTGMTATNTLGIFESLPEYMVIGRQSQLDEIVAKNSDGSDFHIATVFDQNREGVPLDEMSNYLKYAAVAGEDRRFYGHGGVDVPSVARAAIEQVMGTSSSGASTITMQLVRNIRVQEAFNETGVSDQQRAKDLKAAVYPNLSRKLQEMNTPSGWRRSTPSRRSSRRTSTSSVWASILTACRVPPRSISGFLPGGCQLRKRRASWPSFKIPSGTG